MIGDIGTMMWKEWREYFAGPSAGGSRCRSWCSPA